jgi:histone H3/H4
MQIEISPGIEPITLAESNRLIELEKIIEAGRQTFVEVGTALAEIRDSRLYKSDFKTFEDYCIHKWGFKRAHAHRLIKAAGIARDLSPVGDIPSERAAREIAKVPKEKREAVIKTAITEAKSAGRPITAKDIQIAAASAPEAESNIKRIFRVAMRSQRAAVGWWYSRGTTPEKRGQFFQLILTADKDVEVANKDRFTKLVMQWLEQHVRQSGGGHE